MIALIWKGDLLVYNCLIYFTADLFNEYISKKITTFTIYHHISYIIIIFNIITGVIDNKIIESSTIQELSTIPLVLYYMGYVPKPICNIIFSYTFIFVRIICYNYFSHNVYLNNTHIFSNMIIIFTMLININNIGIYWKMNLVQKLLLFILLLHICIINNLK